MHPLLRIVVATLTIGFAMDAHADTFRGTEMQTQHSSEVTVNWSKQSTSVILHYLAPSFNEYEIAVSKSSDILRAEILLKDGTIIQFYETPKEVFGFYESRIVVKRHGRAATTFKVGRILRDQALTLAYVALVPTKDGEVMVICNYEGGATGARQGFAILRVSNKSAALRVLPLTDYGKVVVFAAKPWMAEVWTATSDYVGATATPRSYATQACNWSTSSYRCGPAKRLHGTFNTNAIIEPGIEIRP